MFLAALAFNMYIMSNWIKKKIVGNSILVVVVSAIFMLVGCETRTYISPKQYLEQEQVLLNEFYNSIQEDGNTWLDSMTAVSVDTVDHRGESGMMLFHTEVGEGDSVRLFKRVAYRLTKYEILRDDETNEPGLYYIGSNEYSQSPIVYTTFILNDAGSSSASGVALGINEAILNMRFGGKSTVVLPSLIGDNSYITTAYDLHITYLGN